MQNIRKEAHAQHEKKVGKYTTEERGLHEVQLVLEEGSDSDDELNCIAEASC